MSGLDHANDDVRGFARASATVALVIAGLVMPGLVIAGFVGVQQHRINDVGHHNVVRLHLQIAVLSRSRRRLIQLGK